MIVLFDCPCYIRLACHRLLFLIVKKDRMNNLPVGRVYPHDAMFASVSTPAFANELKNARQLEGKQVKCLSVNPFNQELCDVTLTLRYEKEKELVGGLTTVD